MSAKLWSIALVAARLATPSAAADLENRAPWWLWGLAGLVIGALACAVARRLLRRRRLREQSLEREIAERRRLSAALRQSEERFTKAFRSSPDAVALTTLDKGRFLEVNRGFTRLTGFSREETVGRTARELELWVDPEDRQRMLDELERTGRLREVDWRVQARGGELKSCQCSSEIVEIGGVRCLMSIIRDSTERKAAEAEREKLIEELAAKNRELEARSAEMERFAYTVSHDLKAPLVTIRGFADLLARGLEEGELERAERDLEHIKKASGRMARLLNELLELARVGHVRGEVEDVALARLAAEAIGLNATAIANRGVDVVVGNRIPRVRADRVRILEVFQNLIENAVKFMGEQKEPRIEITAKPDERGLVHCRVADNGIGIEPGHHEKIFELFTRLETQQEGTGIGLALARRIVEGHGGRLWVESEGGLRGSVFHFTLPPAEDADAGRPVAASGEG